MSNTQGFFRPGLRAILLIPLVAALGFGLKYYPGPGSHWVNNWGPASVAYVLFFMLLGFAIVPRRRAIMPIAIIVFAVTCVIEFTQRMNPPWLESIRGTFIGRGLLGDTFSWWDFPAYLVGAITGIAVLHWCIGRQIVESSVETTPNKKE